VNVRLHNTLTRSTEPFQPLQKGQVLFYVCGPTVYDYIHIGNARVFVIFDSLRRFLERCGFRVIYIQNFTDIDDKIINRAREKGVDPRELAEEYIAEYWEDADRLGVRRATHHPRATENVENIIGLIRVLEEKGFTYQVHGDVLFDVSRFPAYGKLSGKKVDELIEGARVESRYKKRSGADFVLWKSAKPGEPRWESPWGPGRPGWHIECSAMVLRYLGHTIDIHAGGTDLTFPHHENEIVQSEAATDHPFARYWLHNGYLNIGEEKMSKSLGNIVTVREMLKQYHPRVLRLVLFSTHYRKPLHLDDEVLSSAERYFERMKNFLRNLSFIEEKVQQAPLCEGKEQEAQFSENIKKCRERFTEALAEDFNTAQALGVVSEFFRTMNRFLQPERGRWSRDTTAGIREFLEEVEEVLGIVPAEEMSVEDRLVQELVEKRQEARAKKEWETADTLREEIHNLGYVVEDTPLGPRWFRTEVESAGDFSVP